MHKMELIIVHADVDGHDPPMAPLPSLTRHKRSTLTNYYMIACAADSHRGSPLPACPPGTRRLFPFHGVPLQPRTPCPPWVDNQGFCHIADRRFSGDRCEPFYGRDLYSEWRRNAYVLLPPGPRTTPPPCLPYP
ncbi:hypothetical protein C0Q70_15070 [Pomacea canaliculata]|uniref:Uncharacterized protein n=1 Tax=Pomacea canaliculata TaxID=400727 RepID=A0A2T7NTW5_POMCA|nr:hypothetical protein C0Q70_15070 [Pomacea canaliculata]